MSTKLFKFSQMILKENRTSSNLSTREPNINEKIPSTNLAHYTRRIIGDFHSNYYHTKKVGLMSVTGISRIKRFAFFISIELSLNRR